jgi:elongation factor Ts
LTISTEAVRALREATGAGVLDCKKALEAVGGDFDKAVGYLREKGLAAAAKKASREANDGRISVTVDQGGRVGIVVEVNCETDFVARTEDFQAFVQAVVRQVAGEDDVLLDVPTMLTRQFIDDTSITVGERLTQLIAKMGENIVLRRFARMERDGDGWIEGYTHPGNRIGVLIQVSAGSADVATSAAFRELVHDLALQVAAAAPKCLSPADIPAETSEAERAIFQAQVAEDKKPDHIKERIVEGRMGKWFEEICLVRQPFVKDGSVEIQDLISQKGKEWDTSLAVERFIRYELGMAD